MSTLESRFAAVRERIRSACERTDREPSSVRLLAVSKKHPASDIEAAYALGQRDFGENYVQELVKKRDSLGHLPDVRLHLIGHLQSNKVNKAVRAAECIHTLDSVKLVGEVDRHARAQGRTISAFVEVNIAGEGQKGGAAPRDVDAIVQAARAATSMNLLGLMAIPPWSDDPEATRPHFRALAALAGDLGLSRLSMGMSGDLETAIEEGATDVRVGTALFGERGNA